MNTYIEAGAGKPPNQPVFLVASVYFLKKVAADLSLGGYFRSSPCGSELCFDRRARVRELKEVSTPASRLACSAPTSHMAARGCAKQQAVSRRQLQAAWPVRAAQSVVLHPSQTNGSGPGGSILWDRAGTSTWEEDLSEYYIYSA